MAREQEDRSTESLGTFSNETKRRLENKGFLIVEGLKLGTLKNFVKEGFIWDTGVITYCLNDSYDFAGERNSYKELAINPNQFFLPKSLNLSIEDQEKILCDFREELKRDVPEVKVVRGNVANHAALAKRLAEQTGKDLYGDLSAFTTTLSYGFDMGKALEERFFPLDNPILPDIITFGCFIKGRGYGVTSTKYVQPIGGTVPLIVPA